MSENEDDDDDDDDEIDDDDEEEEVVVQKVKGKKAGKAKADDPKEQERLAKVNYKDCFTSKNVYRQYA